MVSIVAVDAGSVERLAALHRASFADPWDAAAIAGLLALPGTFALAAVAENPDGPLGFVLLRVAADEAEILTIAVDPGRRRRGIGRRLIEAAAAASIARGASALFLEVAEDNGPALRLYEGMGFRTVGARPGYYRRAAAAVAARAMRLDLPHAD